MKPNLKFFSLMHTCAALFVLGSGLLVMNGCGAGTTNLNVPPPVAGNIPTEYELISATAGKRPDWINAIPDDKDGLHYMIGLSDYQASEQEARDTAMRHARSQYASYTGVEVSEIDAVAKYLSGKESEALDAQLTQRNNSTHKTDASVSRIKAKHFYTETYRSTRRGKFAGNAYKCWVVVTIPVDEDQRVNEWRRQKQERLNSNLQQLQQDANEALQQTTAINEKVINEISTSLSSGKLGQALILMDGETERLSAELKRFQDGTPAMQAKAAAVEHLLLKMDKKNKTVGNLLVIDAGRFGAYYTSAKSGKETIPVWFFLNNGAEHVPVQNVPLSLKNPQGTSLASALTNSAGRAEFYLDTLPEGVYHVSIYSESNFLSSFSKAIRQSLEAVSYNLNIISTRSTIEDTTRLAVRRLFAGASYQPLATEKLLLGPVTYANSAQGGPFALTLQRQLRQQLSSINGLTLVEPRRRSAEMIQQAAQTRGIGLKDQPSIGSGAMQAVIDGAQAALETRYLLESNDVVLELNLKQAKTDIVLAAASAKIDRASIPPGIKLVPEAPVDDIPAPAPTKSAINVEISSHLGNGQTYSEGDAITYFAHLDKDAYLLLVYEDAAGNLIQIFPNKLSDDRRFPAGTAIAVPEKDDGFEFEITAPFGRERVFAFASSQRFEPLPGENHASGLKILSGNMDSLLRRLRPDTSQANIAYGEAFTTLTTVAKQE